MEKSEILDIVKTAVKAVDSKKAIDIKVIGVTDLTIVADYFVICSGSSSTPVSYTHLDVYKRQVLLCLSQM